MLMKKRLLGLRLGIWQLTIKLIETVVGIIGITILFYIFIRIKFGKFLHADTNSEPLIIHLNKDINPEWIQSNKPQQYIKALKSLGFEAGDAYLIKEMEGTQLVSMHQGPICAVVYQHPLTGAWVDMVLNEVEGIEYTVSNAPMGAAIDAPDNTHKVIDPSLTTQEIYTQIQALKNSSLSMKKISGVFLKTLIKKSILVCKPLISN